MRKRFAPVCLILLLLAAAPAAASLSVYMSPERVAEQATLVVEGTVVRTASGLDPETLALATYVTLDVSRVHRGPADLEQVVLREAGGRFGGLVHEIDAVPRYRFGESVLAFLEPGHGGALRTAGMFFGKFEIERPERAPERAVRRLGGHGRILGRPQLEPSETLPLNYLVSLTASTERPRVDRAPSPLPRGTPRERLLDRTSRRVPAAAPRANRTWLAHPVELDRLHWDDVEERPTPGTALPSSTAAGTSTLAPGDGPVGQTARFVALSGSSPARWTQAESGTPVAFHIQPTDNPLGNDAAAVAEMQRAMDAWTDVPESRLVLQTGDIDYDYTGTQPNSPADTYTGINVILFDDPYNEISDPSGCSGVLAIGGYWRSGSTGAPVNNVAFHPILSGHVIFNNDFQCFLGIADNLAEVATHELGHAIGFGHSTVPDAIMRSSAYGGRGPRLGDDDKDGAHCHYPHTVDLSSPDGGESLTVGTLQGVTWSVSGEAGPDPGTVDIEYSTDGGNSWLGVSSGEANDGYYSWSVPNTPGNDVRVRVVRPNLVSATPSPYPDACSADGSAASFSIAAATSVAGAVPDGSTGTPLTLAKAGAGQLTLSWGASCSASASDYAVYEGSLTSLRLGSYEHVPLACSAGTDLTETVMPSPGDRYYLIAPLVGGAEGSLGSASSGTPRPASELACEVRESDSTCP
jgi:hypothetical protein